MFFEFSESLIKTTKIRCIKMEAGKDSEPETGNDEIIQHF
jgi:hypothetical protein